MGFDWYITVITTINEVTGLPEVASIPPIPQEHRKYLSGRGWAYEQLFAKMNFGAGTSCNVSCLDIDSLPEWDDDEEWNTMYEDTEYSKTDMFEDEEDYKGFKAAFEYFAEQDRLDLKQSY